MLACLHANILQGLGLLCVYMSVVWLLTREIKYNKHIYSIYDTYIKQLGWTDQDLWTYFVYVL